VNYNTTDYLFIYSLDQSAAYYSDGFSITNKQNAQPTTWAAGAPTSSSQSTSTSMSSTTSGSSAASQNFPNSTVVTFKVTRGLSSWIAILLGCLMLTRLFRR
jgi:hypothetical protein